MTRPGTRLRSLAARLLDPPTMERLIDPAIADLQHEHEDAIRRGLVWRGRRIRLAGYFAFWKVAGLAAARHALHERTTADDQAVRRTVVFSLVAVTALTALLSWPPLSISRRGGSGTPFWLVLYLLPQALAVTIPLGLVFGILLGLRDRTSTTRVKWTITALAIGCSAAAFIIVGWLMPAANQAFRETLFALINGFDGRPQRGMNELTLGDLRLLARDRVVIPLIASRRAFDFHARLALAFAPLVLGLFALGVSSARRRAVGFLTVGVFGLAGCFAYYSLMYYSRAVMYFAPFEVSEHVPPIVAAWIPNLVFLAMTLFLIRRPLAGPKAAFR